ncbi:hypothetical protein LX90_003064 [Lentzea flava]|nr:hypothetical protein [Lentzea flava]
MGGWVELCAPNQLETVVESVGALSVVAGHRFGGPGDEDLRPHCWVSGWLRRVMWSLARSVSSA